ncbi:ORF70 [Ostreid herpesvirus 1]|uniref:Uncharacterized protein ORF70 n=1 Tax=Ostreid herpesvirus 1 (isolate France) TaxID=654903 RepID=Y070_OSHVF|nr:ORF70 [Ostreid herpesvirus 1]Q6R7F8.1 RecName: Full=Uncharacterized protein ORF70 [Ostreid herpesvirus 1 (isolate France)]AAS00957.1 ORF70 [Ostreid herpesvirus 1]ASK05594.1 ORF70 [Ostreid herpesvirus 1]ASK05725.1 ORF70 [Ostreid herpesvirus 1]AVL26995.1 ORF70 [Ostreid herpesvirus 1]
MATLSDVFHFAKRCRLDSEFSEVIDSCCYHCIEGLNGVDMGTRELVIFLQRFVPRPVIDSPKPDMVLVEKLVHAHTVYRGCKAEKCEIVKRMVNYLFEVKPKSPALKEYIYKNSETMDIGDYWFDDEMYDIIISNLDWQRTRYTADNVHSCYFLLNTHTSKMCMKKARAAMSRLMSPTTLLVIPWFWKRLNHKMSQKHTM